MPTVPISHERQVLLDIISLLEADPHLKAAFSFEDATGLSDPDTRARRIYRADNGAVEPTLGVKLCLRLFMSGETADIYGDDGGWHRARVRIAAVVYVHVGKDSDGEAETDLVEDLTGLVRDRIRPLADDGGPDGWEDIRFAEPTATMYDSSETFERSVTLFDVYLRCPNLREP